MSKIRVMIVEDSRVVRELLHYVIDNDPRLEVVAAVATAEEALRLLTPVSPDVISMDIRLPGMNGLEATQQIMREKPTPIVVVSASVAGEELQTSMNALRAGALSVVEKPVGITNRDYEQLAGRLCNQLAAMSEVKVIRQRALRAPAAEPGAARKLPALPSAAGAVGSYQMVGIVASTGGPNALANVLRRLGPDFPLPIVLVQHITSSFLEGFVTWLDGICPFDVVVAAEGASAKPGVAYVAPADRHLSVERSVLRLTADAPISSQRPAGTMLFRSMARSLGPRGIGVLLTGMGDDGALGLKELRDAGGYTIAEDESTAVVYGMPAVAVRLGGVCESLPLDAIGPRLEQLSRKE